MEIDCVPSASLILHRSPIRPKDSIKTCLLVHFSDFFFFIQSPRQILILIDMQWTTIIMTAFILNDMLQFCHWVSLWGHCWSFFFFFMALVVINLLVRQFRAKEGFSLGVQVWAGKANPLFARWKRLFSLARWWMWCRRRCMPLLALSLLRSHYSPLVFVLFFFSSITHLVHFPPRVLSSHHSATLFLLFSPICSHRLTHRIYCKLLYLSFFLPSLPPSPLALISFLYVILSFFSQWIGCWLGHGLQHRTWVLPLLPARVLCCSQWSCLSASLPVCLPTAAELRSPEQLDPTNHGAADSAAGFASNSTLNCH